MQDAGLRKRIGAWLSRYLERDSDTARPYVAQDFDALRAHLRVGDVLLVEGRARVSTAIRYLTQSTWSHAALCVSDAVSPPLAEGLAPGTLVEVTLETGCVPVPLTKYEGFNTRICRAAGLDADERRAVARYLLDRVGLRYDLRNVIDLARYLLPMPPVPGRWRRRMLSFGSGDPTRAICSSLIAQAFQEVGYPILPDIRLAATLDDSAQTRREVWHIRHHSLYVPRDFDLSPYFAVIKPTIRRGFDHHRIPWATGSEARPLPDLPNLESQP